MWSYSDLNIIKKGVVMLFVSVNSIIALLANVSTICMFVIMVYKMIKK
nr:MAG TPA: hypothetical protein [Caudoviricetes sp.]